MYDLQTYKSIQVQFGRYTYCGATKGFVNHLAESALELQGDCKTALDVRAKPLSCCQPLRNLMVCSILQYLAMPHPSSHNIGTLFAAQNSPCLPKRVQLEKPCRKKHNQQQVAINAHAAAETCLNNLTRNFDKAWFDSLNNSFRSWFNHLRTRGAQSKVTCWYCHGCAKIEPYWAI